MSAKQKRQGLRLSAQKALDAIQRLKEQDSSAAREQLPKKAALLKSYLDRIEPLDNEVLAAIFDADEIEKELDSIRTANDRLLEAIADAENNVSSPASPSGIPAHLLASGGIDTARVKLPLLQITPFEGDPLRWQEFWDSFKASIHDRSDLNPVDKFTYLRSLLKGDPFHLVEGFRVTDANYEPVVSLLSQRFGDKQAVIFAHIEALLSVPASSGEVSSLVEMHSSVERHLRSLDSLQPDPDAILYAVLLSKLPRFLKIEVHRQRVAKDNWDFKSFREWLQQEIRAREMGDRLQLLRGSNPSQRHGSRPTASPKSGQPDRRNQKGVSSTHFLVSQSTPASCPFCNSGHGAEQCTRYPDTQSRRAQLGNRCLSCLKRGHLAKECRGRRQCRFCHRLGHHPSLCFSRFGKPNSSENTKSALPEERRKENSESALESRGDPSVTVATVTPQAASKPSGERTVMQTALVDLVNVSGPQLVKARIMFDTGASRSFITMAKQRELKLHALRKDCLSVSTFQCSKRQIRKYNIVGFGVKCRDGSISPVTAAVAPTITCPIQKVALDANALTVPAWTLAEPMIETSELVGIDILIGMDYYHSFMLPQRVQAGENLWFHESKVGYIVSGRVDTDESGPETVAVMLLRTGRDAIAVESPEIDVSKFWDLEEIGMKESRDGGDSDEDALASFSSTIKFEKGRYQVCWPWKQEDKELKDNRGLAYGRLKSVVSQLKKSGNLLQAYHEVFQTQLAAGIIERVPSHFPSDNPVYYMPHHGVFNPQKPTTKLRVVFDASSKVNANAASLNDCLHRGPVWLEDLCGLLLRFRTHAVALVSDIEKAFLQIGLQPDHRDVTRFLWLEDPKEQPTGSNIIPYRFCRVPFGVISSPFLLAATVAHHLKQQSSPVATKVARDVYVDNVITGEASLDEAFSHYTEAKSIFRSASMNLREWHSSSSSLMEKIPREDHGKSLEPKVLGLHWHTVSDTLRIGPLNFKYGDGRVTKRIMLKILAQLFDPCGFLAPVVVRGKLMIQDMWARKLPWDEDVPDEVRKDWESYICKSLQRLHLITVPRYIGNAPGRSLQLHAFCDASTKACAVALYVRMGNPHSHATTALILARTRLAPLKQKTTIPRMELVAAVLGTRVLNFAADHLQLPIEAQFLWTDSQCVLHWINKEQIATNFVVNRVKELKRAELVQYRYVPTAENPADLPTRGCDVQTLQASNPWRHGPQWLSGGLDGWPVQPQIGAQEAKEADALLVDNTSSSDPYPPPHQNVALIDIERFGSLNRLLCATAFMFRFVHNVRAPANERLGGNLLLKEIASAQEWWIKEVQSKNFFNISETDGNGGKPTKLNRLNTFRDEQGLIRCHGRIDNSNLAYNARFPVLLPAKSHFTTLLIKAYHERSLHAGVAVTLSNIRQQFWIPCGRSAVKKLIRLCRVCIRHGGGHFRLPAAPPLPKLRLEESPPFSNTGLDYLGPLLVQEGDENIKVWICLYTCAVTRAVHLEVVQSLSTEHFFLALRRFAALYGTPKIIISDNGRQFQMASKIIRDFERQVSNSDAFQDLSLSRGIKWKFIPEMSPWMGGFYERLVGIVKSSLKKSLQIHMVNLVQLQTLIYEVASVVNTRPLTYVEVGPESLPLTPSQLLFPMRVEQGILMPPRDPDPSHLPSANRSDVLVDRWRRAKAVLRDFWRSWRSNYLLALRERSVQTHQRGASAWNPRVGSVVHIKNNLPRAAWKLGKIQSVCESADGSIRSALVRTPNGTILRRPLKLLYPLEVDSDDHGSQQSSQPDPGARSCDDLPSGKVKRAAAVRARSKWLQQQRSEDVDEEHMNNISAASVSCLDIAPSFSTCRQ